MKRLISVLLLTMMAMAICSTALAGSFTATLNCASTADSAYVSLGSWTASEGKTGKIYVYHTVGTESAKKLGYTNHFRIYVNTATSANNNKWIAPGSNVSILSSAIGVGDDVTVKARGNTKYNDAGFSSISVSGSIGWPL